LTNKKIEIFVEVISKQIQMCILCNHARRKITMKDEVYCHIVKQSRHNLNVQFLGNFKAVSYS